MDRLVGISAAGVGSADSGLLSIWLGTIVLQPSGFARRLGHLPAELRHTSGEVIMLEARLIPFWCNTALILGDEQALAAANVPGWSRRPIRAELNRAGISVRRVKTWFDIGVTRTRGF